MKKIYKKHLVLTAVVIAGVLSLNYSSGPANGGLSVTGSSFSTPYGAGSYCTSCHGGGSFAPTATVQLYSGSSPVTGNYVAGASYTLRITRTANAAHTALANSGFGFQVTNVRSTNNANINTWGTPPANTANRVLNTRNYIEHTTKLSKAITVIDIPWTGPAQGTGTVAFYLALNTVNGDGGTTGDHPITAVASYTQAPLPLTWLYFNGRENAGNVLLEWGTANEVNNAYFTVERSVNGIDFEVMKNIDAVKGSLSETRYSFADEQPFANGYYRIRQTDLSGNSSYYKTIQVRASLSNPVTHYVDRNSVMVSMDRDEPGSMKICMYNMEGKRMSQHNFNAVPGKNTFSIEKPLVPGIYAITVEHGEDKIYFNKVFID